MSDETIRIGVVGAGANTTKFHIPGLQAIAGVEVTSVCNRSYESSKRVADQFNIPTIYEHWSQLIEASDTNAIVIGTWPYTHCEMTLAALQAGKHVLCEARMAMNAFQAQAMLEASRERPGLITQLVPAPHTLKVDNTIKRMIAEGFLGNLLALEVRHYGNFIEPDAPLHWRQDVDLSGLNIMTMGIFYEAVMRWVGNARKVMAMGKTFVKMRKDPQTGLQRAVQVPEHLDVLADMVCGAQARFGISNVTGLQPAFEILLFGSQGTLKFVDDQLLGGRRSDPSLSEIPIPPGEEGGWRVEEEFISAIRGNERITHTSFEDGVKYMEFTEAVNLSLRDEQAITLPLL